jgi:hypothetical protein
MTPLDPSLRKLLENKIPDVRQTAEEAARAILNTLAVNRAEPFPGMTPEQRRLRNALRAKARQLGEGSQTDGFEPLVEELAYQQWHRMVFARFLAENNLLMHPSGVPVTLLECGELAKEESEIDAWAVAARYASLMLPGIFRQEDPESQIRFAPEGQQKLETVLNNLPSPIYLADDALGWMYQFWQSRKKEEINKSERKIGGADIAPVTQLFTEDYMVRFLLENSLGAWWAARHPESPLVKTWEFLRFKEDGTPAAGSFPGWPERAVEVTVMDPCCGSGHFLVAAFDMLIQMRMEEENLIEIDAAECVLHDNIFGLEIDQRCTQIAAFALALAAWKHGGYRALPIPNIACSGIPVKGQLETWQKLAENDSRLRAGIERLYGLFKNAPDLGSLINPAALPAADRMFVADFEQVAPVLEEALAKENSSDDPVSEVFGSVVEGIAKAAKFLVKKYVVVVTNVPYLVQGKQNEVIREYCTDNYSETSKDLATTFVSRCLEFASDFGTIALLTPHNWRFLQAYRVMRRNLLKFKTWNFIVNLGNKAFNTPMWDFNVGFSIISNGKPAINQMMVGLDVSTNKSPNEKAVALSNKELVSIPQIEVSRNKNSLITLELLNRGTKLSDYVTVHVGSQPGQTNRVTRCFWEIYRFNPNIWILMESSPRNKSPFSGKSEIFLTIQALEKSDITEYVIRGRKAWGKRGVILSKVNNLPSSLYVGEFFDDNTYVLIPTNSEYLSPVFYYVRTDEYLKEVRKINQKLAITAEAMVDVPFDLERWQRVAKQAGPLPEPYSNDPTQWLFCGHPVGSTNPLQVAAALMLGYTWPQQQSDTLENMVDEDSIVCLPPVAGEKPFSERLREVLTLVFGNEWSPNLQNELLSAVGAQGKSLEDWLRDDFFTQHCRLFHNRPFIWHIWDGRKDGFSALVNYHRLNSAGIDKLIYTYLGDWIRFQRARRDHGEPGADGRLVAALELEKKLKLIKEGEPPYDIYVRWKSLAEQPIGWEPDLNDGVRINIRPFVTAGVLRSKFTLNWNKDRGKNPDGSERLNDLHFSIAEKIKSRGG